MLAVMAVAAAALVSADASAVSETQLQQLEFIDASCPVDASGGLAC